MSHSALEGKDAKAAITAHMAIEEAVRMVKGRKSATIDCNVLEMDGIHLNNLMKALRSSGVDDFTLLNVCGQNIIGTGVQGPARISVYGLMGNHSAAFVDRIELNTFPTYFPNNVWCPGDAQVAIGNTANPTELNVGGSVDDLFASYCPSGIFRVAGQGGNRCGLRGGAGIPHVWREIDYSEYTDMTCDERVEDMLYKYQMRKATLKRLGFREFLQEFRQKVEDREPPVICFGRKIRDYFMEYAQGTIGVVFNIYEADSPAGYYICSGMTAGRAFIRGRVEKDQLGINVRFATMTDESRAFVTDQFDQFYKTFSGRLTSTYQERIDGMMEVFTKDPERILDEFVKIVPLDSDE